MGSVSAIYAGRSRYDSHAKSGQFKAERPVLHKKHILQGIDIYSDSTGKLDLAALRNRFVRAGGKIFSHDGGMPEGRYLERGDIPLALPGSSLKHRKACEQA